MNSRLGGSSKSDTYNSLARSRSLALTLTLVRQATNDASTSTHDIIRDVFDISSTLNDAASALVDDSFLRCFKSAIDEPWNWNFYLFPLWLVGVVVRNLILFPLRLVTLLLVRVDDESSKTDQDRQATCAWVGLTATGSGATATRR